LVFRNHGVPHDLFLFLIVAIERVELFIASINLERLPPNEVNGVLLYLFKGYGLNNLMQVVSGQLDEFKGPSLLCLPLGRKIENLCNSILERGWQGWFCLKLLELYFEGVKSLILRGNFRVKIFTVFDNLL